MQYAEHEAALCLLLFVGLCAAFFALRAHYKIQILIHAERMKREQEEKQNKEQEQCKTTL